MAQTFNKDFDVDENFLNSVSHLVSDMKNEIGTITLSNYKSVLKRVVRSLEVQVKANPYGMLKNGLAVGAALAALNSKQFRDGALYLVKAAMFKAINNQNNEETV